MRILSAILVLVLCATAFAGAPAGADGNTINQWVQLALTLDPAKVTEPGKNKFACQNMDGELAYAKDQAQAHAAAVLMCIRQRCEKIETQVNAEVARIQNLSREEIVDLLIGMGRGANAGEMADRIKRGETGGSTTCVSSQQARYAIYDMCSFSPYSCGKVSRR